MEIFMRYLFLIFFLTACAQKQTHFGHNFQQHFPGIHKLKNKSHRHELIRSWIRKKTKSHFQLPE